VITFIFRGELAERYGERHRLEVRSVAEGFHAIDVLHGGLFDYIWQLEERMQGYHIRVGERDIGEGLLDFGFVEETVVVTPLLRGCDTKGILQIVAGVALIAVGIAAAAYGGGFVATLGLQVVGLGLAISLGGVARLLMTAPESALGTQDKSRSSYIFTGAVNTVQQGECMPVAFGDVITGSAVVAAGMESEDVQV
jgi:predicted phage tail protein